MSICKRTAGFLLTLTSLVSLTHFAMGMTICDATAQHTANAGTDIAACMALLPANSNSQYIASGGIIDARGYTGNQVIAGLTITRPITLLMGAANFDVTGVINATDLFGGFAIQGAGTVLIADTGPGKPVIDSMGSYSLVLDRVVIAKGTSNPSTIGILEGRTAAHRNPWWHHLNNVQINLQSNLAANSGNGTVGIYNDGSEVNHYENVTIGADKPLVLARSNIFGITPPDVPFYTGVTTMTGVTVDGKSDFYSTTGPIVTLSGAEQITLDVGEAYGPNKPGVYAIAATGNLNNDYIRGEFEGYTRIMYLGALYGNTGAAFNNSAIELSCSSCQYNQFTGTLALVNGSSTATPSVMTGLSAGQLLTGAGIPNGTLISSVGSSTITLSAAATSSVTEAVTAGEPTIYIDGTGSTPAGRMDFTKINIQMGASGPPQLNLIEAVGSQVDGSLGWTVYLPVATNIAWTSYSALNAPVTGIIYAPQESGDPQPVVSPYVLGILVNNIGARIIGKETVSTTQVGNLAPFAGGSFSFPASGDIIASTTVMSPQGFSPSTTFGAYDIIATPTGGGYFLNGQGGDLVLAAVGHRVLIGGLGGTGAGSNLGMSVDLNGNAVIPNTLMFGGGAIIGSSSSLATVGKPTVGQATCVKAAGPPVLIGYCSTAVGPTGACTCN